MTKLIAVATMLASLLAFSGNGQAAAGPASESFAAGTRAFGAGDYLLALSHFQVARDAGMQGPSVRYNIGVCQYKLADYRPAEATFRAIARDYPAMRELAHYNVGLALERQGREAEAQSFFQRAQENGGDEKLARLAGAKLRASERSSARAAPTWLTLLDLNLGHDDNVALLDETALVAGHSVDSPFTEISAFVTGPLNKATGFRLDASGYFVRYGDASEFDQDVVRLGGMYRWRRSAWRMEAGPHMLHSFLDGGKLEQRIGVGLSLRRNLTGNSTFGIRIAHDEIDAGSGQFSFLEGSRQHVGLTFDRNGASNRVTLGFDLEANDREGASVSPTRHRLWVRHRYVMGAAWTTDLLLAYRASAYDELSVTRDEDLLEISAGVIRSLGGRWEFNARYAWSENDSNVEAFSYDRSRLAMGLTKGF